MPVRRIKEADMVPAGRGTSHSPLMKSTEWSEALAILQSGLKPHEAVEVSVEGIRLHPNSSREAAPSRFAFHLRKEIKKLGLSYDVITNKKKQLVYIVGR